MSKRKRENKLTWSEIAQAITKGHFLEILGGMEEKTLADVAKRSGELLKTLPEHRSPLMIMVSTTGGSMTTAWAIASYIHLLAVHYDVYLICIGDLYSAGNCLLPAVPHARRYATPNAWFLMHQSTHGAYGNGGRLGVSELERLGAETDSTVDHLRKMKHEQQNALAREGNMTMRKLKKLTRSATRLSAKEAVRYGFVVGIVDN
jgi:ATP-dependent protease ClpP protease subunit